MSRIVLISDTHTYEKGIKNMPKGDILIHAGDSTNTGEISEMKAFLKWFAEQPFENKIFINGNHEVGVSRLGNLTRVIVNDEFKDSGITYLENESARIEGLNFYGSPYTPEFFPEHWAYQLKEKDAEGMWSMIPDDTDVLITHGPAYGKMDKVKPMPRYDREHAGCPYLLKRVLEIKPKLFVCGHIHSGYSWIQGKETLYVNASTCNEEYEPVNAPVVVDSNTWKVLNI